MDAMAVEASDTERDRIPLAVRQAVMRLPSTIARLVFLSGLRDPNSGTYRYPAALNEVERAFIDQYLRGIHDATFAVWLNYRLEEQKADLDLYFSGLDCSKASAVRPWLCLESYRSLVPASAGSVERQLFYTNLEVLLRVMAHEVAGLANGAQPAAPDELLLGPRELAKRLGVSRRTLCLWAQRQRIPAVRVGRQWRFSLTDILRWLRSRQTVGRAIADAPEVTGAQDHAAQPRTGLVLKNSSGSCALTCSRAGLYGLTAREQNVLNLIGRGKTSKEIAASLSISVTTVSEYRKRICSKLGLHSTAELVACAVRRLNGTCQEPGPLKDARIQDPS